MSKASASVAVLAGAVNSVTPVQILVVIVIGGVAAASALSEDIWDGFRGRARKFRSGSERGVEEQECNAGD